VKTLTANLLHFLHMGILLFIVGAPYCSWPTLLRIHLVAIPLIFLQWKLNSGRCVLTQWEHLLRRPKDLNEPSDEDGFVKSILSRFFKELPSDTTIRRGIYTVTWGSWAVTLL